MKNGFAQGVLIGWVLGILTIMVLLFSILEKDVSVETNRKPVTEYKMVVDFKKKHSERVL